MKTWPTDRDEAPTAHDIALAIVRAADWTGQRDALRAVAGDVGAFRSAVLRCKWLALAALHELFPRAPVDTLARMVGGSANWKVSLGYAQKQSWWTEGALNAAMYGTAEA